MNRLSTRGDAPEDRAGRLLAARLNEGLPQVPADIAERLRFAREKALSRARQARAQAAYTGPLAWPVAGELAWAGVSTDAGRPLSGSGGQTGWGWLNLGSRASGSGWSKWISAMPLLILALGFWAIHDTLTERQIQAAAEVDAALLADDLPPQAYSDPGFAEFLRRQER